MGLFDIFTKKVTRVCKKVNMRDRSSYLVNVTRDEANKDIPKLLKSGLYCYLVDQKYGEPYRLYKDEVVEEFYGYIVMNESMNFPFRRKEPSAFYFTLNNQYTKIGEENKVVLTDISVY